MCNINLALLIDIAGLSSHRFTLQWQMTLKLGPTLTNVTHFHLLTASKPKESSCFGLKIYAALKVFTFSVPLPSDWTSFPPLLLVSIQCKTTVSLSAPQSVIMTATFEVGHKQMKENGNKRRQFSEKVQIAEARDDKMTLYHLCSVG